MEKILIEPMIMSLNNIQLKINDASGAATALELRLRIIAQLDSQVQSELKKPYFEVELLHLINAVLKVYSSCLDAEEQEKIKRCRLPRNKTIHGSMVELMLELGIEPTGRTFDPRSGKRNLLSKENLVEGVKSIERNNGLEKFTRDTKEIIEILERKVLRKIRQ